MSFLKVAIPFLIVFGILQAAVLTLPFLYLRFEYYLNPLEKCLFAALLSVYLRHESPLLHSHRLILHIT